ncbi:MAG: Pycsar system effector family protein [Candidatus Methanofastidiosia archaeon]
MSNREFDETTKVKMDFGKLVHNHNMKMIEMADVKGGLIITFSGVLIGVSLYIESPGDSFSGVIRLIASLFLLGAALLSFFVIYPRLHTEEKKTNFFFQEIIETGRTGYISGIIKSSSNELLENLFGDIFTLAEIEEKKYRYLRISMSVFVLGFVFFFLSISYDILRILVLDC